MTIDLHGLEEAEWLNEPPFWQRTPAGLVLETGERTDFWRGTYYGFDHRDGHFLGASVTDDFCATVTFEADYSVLYDQAGLMLRRDDETWVKAGIELTDGAAHFSVVVTRGGRSDWSAVRVPAVAGPQSIRLTRVRDAVLVHFLAAPGQWRFLRLADFSTDGALRVGPMACSPQRAGLKVRFLSFVLTPPAADPLHDPAGEGGVTA
ncbi:DUF1349 domain-containing protein [Consotaella salsifontis]|uniref:Regulation of enolase protein 1, concanavalin A-like superfamily n=1 Tax=Consotaella salsifontis TaxID=1365950 RepID=A0A1T4T4Q1_9HYPH|nr:DUF1349 domain-containing protein [Consotaella salsifontis]SKA35500.1 hypothetical protein SAMN05428963_11943 [Consotaella salsifontis]